MAIEKRTFPSDEADKFVLRMPPGMRDQIAAAAKAAGRSMNAEIVARLQLPAGSDASRDIQFLIRKHEQELAEAALDRHVMYWMLHQLAFDNRALGNTLRHFKEAGPQILETIAEWERESEQLLVEAREMLTESLEEARVKAEATTQRLIETFQRRRGYIARMALEGGQTEDEGEAVMARQRERFPAPGSARPSSASSDVASSESAGERAEVYDLMELTGGKVAGTLTPAEKEELDALAHGLPQPDRRATSEPAPTPVKKGSFSHLPRGKKLGK